MLTCPVDFVRAALSYDPITGVLVWRKSGEVAGYILARGYRGVFLGGKLYYAHRLIWAYVHGEWPVKQIDHMDGHRDNNAIANLREATAGENRRNQTKRHGKNKSGVTGVCWDAVRQRWRATIGLRGRTISLGYFVDMEAAAKARAEGSVSYHGEFSPLQHGSPHQQG